MYKPASDDLEFLRTIKSRQSYVNFQKKMHSPVPLGANNNGANSSSSNGANGVPVETWSREKHSKALQEKDRVVNLVNIERHALQLHRRVTVRLGCFFVVLVVYLRPALPNQPLFLS